MCRMLGIIASRPVNAYYYLVEAECSLLAQAEKGRQSDGWGIGYYVNGEAKVFKRTGAAYEEEGLFKEKAKNIASKILIAHVRKASNPRGLPKHMLIAEENSQPFYWDEVIFTHNGTIWALNIVEYLGEYKHMIRGLNDSEVYFVYFLKEWRERGDPIEALRSVERGLWDALRKGEGKRTKPYSSLNAIFSDGKKLYAVTKYLEGEKLKSICYGDAEYFRMAYRYEGDKLIVASEKVDREEWKLLSNGDVLIAELREGQVKYRIEKL